MIDAAGLFHLSNYFFNPYAIPFLFAALLTLFVGSYVFVYGGRKQQASFVAICLSMFLWVFSTVFVYSCRNPEQAMFYIYFTYAGIVFVPPSLYWYASAWFGWGRANRAIIITGYVLAAVFLGLTVFTREIVTGTSQFFWGHHSRLSLLGLYIFLPYFFGYVALFFHTLFRGYRTAVSIHVKKQVVLVTCAFAIAFFGTLDFFPCFGVAIFPTGGLITFAAFCVLSYTIIRYKLFDIETVIHMTLMWLATSAVAVLPFAGIVYSTQPFARKLGPLGMSLYFFALALVFYAYFRTLQPRLAQLFQRRRASLMGILDRFSGELVHLKDLRDLLQSFARMLRRQVYVRRLSVFLFDEVKNEYVAVIAKGLRNLKPFPAAHPFLKWLEKTDAVTVVKYVISDPSVEKFKDEVTDCFVKAQASVAVPFVIGGKMIGVAFLGKKATLRRYNSGEIQFLTRLKAPVTIAFSNSVRFESIRELSEELRRWNEELEVRVEERTRELVKTQEQLIQAEKLATLGTLAGGVAHEINNPLTAVLTNAQILKMTAVDGDTKESLDLIEEGAKRCQLIVQKLMKYARKTAEESPFKPVDLNEVVKSTLNLIGFQFRQENVEVVTQLGKIPSVPGISNELEQVLTNLLVNARDAVKAVSATKPADPSSSRGGKGRIEVITRQAKDIVELIVKDNGIGISKENLHKIFDPFFTTKDVGSGTGLGLAVTFGILKRHKATITADSQPDQGATFVIRFPTQPPPNKTPA